MNKTIYHLSHIDLDGYSCQLVMRHTPYVIHSYNANYGAEVVERLEEIVEALHNSNEAAIILVTDLNLTVDEAKWLDQEVKSLNQKGRDITITLLDHHGSGRDCSERFEWYYLDTERCATKITFDYALIHYHLDEPAWMDGYVNVVNAVDLWHQNEVESFEYGKVCMRLVSETRELNRVMFANEDREYKISLLLRAAEMMHVPDAPIMLDEAIHKMKKEFFKKDLDNTLDNLATAYIVELLGHKRNIMTIYYKGYRGFLSYGVGNTSIIGNGFLTTFDEYDFIVDISYRGTMSLRANNKVDVSLIAKEWAGGGGHPNASGGRIQGFKEQYRYDRVKDQIEGLIANKESVAGKLEPKA